MESAKRRNPEPAMILSGINTTWLNRSRPFPPVLSYLPRDLAFPCTEKSQQYDVKISGQYLRRMKRNRGSTTDGGSRDGSCDCNHVKPRHERRWRRLWAPAVESMGRQGQWSQTTVKPHVELSEDNAPWGCYQQVGFGMDPARPATNPPIHSLAFHHNSTHTGQHFCESDQSHMLIISVYIFKIMFLNSIWK